VFELRPATERDYELLWKIQRTSIGPYVDATWGWDKAFQRSYFDEHFDHRKYQIILVGKSDAGFLSLGLREDHVYLANLALLPPYQRRGIGAAVVEYVIQQANQANLPIRLQVLKSNPARRFYERLGFKPCGETDTHFQLARGRGAAFYEDGPVKPSSS
jgi:ribosomal protein S18 acetylase RimI-like enzyme